MVFVSVTLPGTALDVLLPLQDRNPEIPHSVGSSSLVLLPILNNFRTFSIEVDNFLIRCLTQFVY